MTQINYLSNQEAKTSTKPPITLLLTLLLCCVTTLLVAQPFVSARGTTRGLGASLGFIEPKTLIEASGTVQTSLTSDIDKPVILFWSIGKTIYLFGDRTTSNISTTLNVGRATLMQKRFVPDGYVENTYKGWIGTVELNYEFAPEFRVFAMAGVTQITYFGVGFKGILCDLLPSTRTDNNRSSKRNVY